MERIDQFTFSSNDHRLLDPAVHLLPTGWLERSKGRRFSFTWELFVGDDCTFEGNGFSRVERWSMGDIALAFGGLYIIGTREGSFSRQLPSPMILHEEDNDYELFALSWEQAQNKKKMETLNYNAELNYGSFLLLRRNIRSAIIVITFSKCPSSNLFRVIERAFLASLSNALLEIHRSVLDFLFRSIE